MNQKLLLQLWSSALLVRAIFHCIDAMRCTLQSLTQNSLYRNRLRFNNLRWFLFLYFYNLHTFLRINFANKIFDFSIVRTAELKILLFSKIQGSLPGLPLYPTPVLSKSLYYSAMLIELLDTTSSFRALSLTIT